MLFSDVIAQDETKQHLVDMVQHNRLSHALLFLGKEGCGALPLAIAFAQYVVSLPLTTVLEPAASSLFGAQEATKPTVNSLLPSPQEISHTQSPFRIHTNK